MNIMNSTFNNKMNSLQTICINLIAEQFGKFHFAFTSSKDEVLKRNFEFLQRKYSYELLSALPFTATLNTKYLQFFINEHVKHFQAHFFIGCLVIEDIIYRLPNLTKFVFNFFCNDEVLENLARYCPKIAELDVSDSPGVTDAGVKSLCKIRNGKASCPELKIIDLQDTEVTDESIRCLIENVPSLERIYHTNIPLVIYSIHKENLSGLEKLPSYNLDYLDFFGFERLPYYCDILKICLTVCPQLKCVRCYISDKMQLTLFNNISLLELHLIVVKWIPKLNISDFLKQYGSNLRSLSVWNCILSIFDLGASCLKLKELRVKNCTFFDNENASQSVLFDLRECLLCDIKDESADKKAMRLLLLCSPKLEIVCFHDCDLSTETKSLILKCCEKCQLKEICFTNIRFEMSFVKNVLLSCTSLTTMFIENISHSYRDIMELTEFVQTLSNKPRVSIDNIYFDHEENANEEENNNEVGNQEGGHNEGSNNVKDDNQDDYEEGANQDVNQEDHEEVDDEKKVCNVKEDFKEGDNQQEQYEEEGDNEVDDYSREKQVKKKMKMI